MKQIMTRRELMDLLKISRTHLIRKLKNHNIEPIKGMVCSNTKYYNVT